MPGKGRAVIATLHHFALEVPDLEVAEGFLQDFGLETGEKDGPGVRRRPGARLADLHRPGPRLRLSRLMITLTDIAYVRSGVADLGAATRFATDIVGLELAAPPSPASRRWP